MNLENDNSSFSDCFQTTHPFKANSDRARPYCQHNLDNDIQLFVFEIPYCVVCCVSVYLSE
jgi:hypothetical protein